MDLNLSYTFSRRVVEGVEDATDPDTDPGKAVATSEGVSATWAWYIWEYTALEFNYATSTNRIEDTRETATSDDSVTIISVDSIQTTNVSGVGLRQSFADRKSVIIPSLSIGYAELKTSCSTTYKLDNNGTEESLKIENDTQTQKSSYATFQLRFRITEFMGFLLAAKTVMPDFETSKAQNNVTYSAGFSWVF